MLRPIFLFFALLAGIALAAQPTLYNNTQLYVEAGAQLFVEGDLTNDAAGSLTAPGEVHLAGDWTNNGKYRPLAQGKVRFYGSSTATLSGSTTGLDAFHRLEVALSPGKTLSLNQDTEVVDTLRLSGGILATGSFTLQHLSPTKGLITGYPLPGSAVDDRYLAGELERTTGFTGILYDFPVGALPGLGGYQLVRLNASNLGGMSSLAVSYDPNASNTPPMSNECGASFDCVLSGHGGWTFVPDAGSPQYDLTVVPRNFALGCGAGSYTLMRSGGLSGTACSGFSGSLDPNNGTEVTRTGLSGFGPIAIAGSSSSFPVEWLRFTASPLAGQVRLAWTTGRELNNDYFVVERSQDGLTFSALGQVDGMGTTQVPTDYEYHDRQPFTGTNYYRLRQVDQDGSFQYSEVRTVTFAGDRQQLVIGPNPTHGHIQLAYPQGQPLQFQLFNALGQRLSSHRFPTGGQAQLDLHHLPEGTYFYRAIQSGQLIGQGKVVRL